MNRLIKFPKLALIVGTLALFGVFPTQDALSQSSLFSSAIEKAFLKQDWETVSRLIAKTPDSLRTPIEQVLAYHSCLALDCNDYIVSDKLDVFEGRNVLAWAARLNKGNPDHAVCLYFWGVGYQLAGEKERAILKFEKALKADSEFFMAHILLALLRYSQGDARAAIDHYTEAIRIAPNNSKAYTSRGGILDDQGKFEQAIGDYDAVLKMNPGDPMALYNRANSYRHLGRNQRAIADYTVVIEMQPEFASAYNNRGNAHADLKHWEAALADYKQFIFLAPFEMGPQIEMVRASAQSIKNLKFFNENFKAAEVYNRGIDAAQAGNFDKALSHFDETLKITSDFALIYQMRGLVHTEIGDWSAHQNALADFKRAIELDPDDYMNYLHIAEIYNRVGVSEIAISYCSKALELSPNNLRIIFSRAFSLIVGGDREKAIEDYSFILNLQPENPSALRARASAYKMNGDTAKALADYKASIIYTHPDDTQSLQRTKQQIRELEG